MKRPRWQVVSVNLRSPGRPRCLAAILVAAVALLCAGTTARADDRGDGLVRIMTQNMYEGTNFTEIVSATSPAAFLSAVTLTYQNILATQPAVRAAAVAKQIARERPDLVALQEAAILRSGLVPVTAPPTPVPTVDEDQLVLLLAELERLGRPYHPVAIVPNLDAQAPSSTGNSVRITDRTVILARGGHSADDIKLSNAQVQEFLAVRAFPTPVGVSIPNLRGWASVDVKVNGRAFRLITTHLETVQPFNLAQAKEALQSAVNSTTLPVVFVGDFNVVANSPSDPTFTTYQALINAGLIDAWQQKRSADPGFTCCQLPTVDNATTNLNQRIDLVLIRGRIDVRDIRLVGDQPSDRVGGFWPSDHAGIVATLKIHGGAGPTQ
jgi:endonuclease/exonuclease/phosphatase family metal-dependent hydrolase